MRRLLSALCLILFAAAPAAAETFFEPKRGSELRADLMSAIRPHAEWALGKPVQFVIHDLRTDGAVAFAMVTAQRPGGQQIDLARTPLALRDGEYVDDMDGATMQALLVKSGRVWVAVEHTIGATEAWWDYPARYCADWASVLPHTCR
jgi:hypothetical protein